jgi:primosomal protein N' (replication factor Y) (superfamily II helicase)
VASQGSHADGPVGVPGAPGASPPADAVGVSRAPRPVRGASASRAARQPAATLPVAKVAVEISLPNLDRPFEYLVPDTMSEAAVPGCRVRVRFAGRLTGGYLLDRTAQSEHQGKLGYLERVVSPEPVLTPEIAGLARAVADRYGGTLADVLRLAIPPRHAAVESGRDPRSRRSAAAGGPGGLAASGGSAGPGGSAEADGPDGERPDAIRPAAEADRATSASPAAPADQDRQPWDRYLAGPAFLAALAAGRSPRAVWAALPGPDWPDEIALAVAAVTTGGRGAVIVVPDVRDLERVDGALDRRLGPGRHVVLSAGLGPAERYRRWLSAARGEVAVVAGTRSASFAPVANLGLVVLWDEGDDLHAEPRAPYPHAREVLAIRAHRSRAAALIGGFARTAEAALLLAGGWARPLAAERAVVRQAAPAVVPAGDDPELARDEAARSARLPSLALRTARDALSSGPVLVQVPRHGYLAAVACERCRTQARCRCGGPAGLPGPAAALRCGWCGADLRRSCARCGHEGLRALVTGSSRTAEELTRAFPSVPVLTSDGTAVLAAVAADPAIVVATPGAEPVAQTGYSAAVLLDGWALLGRASLRAAEEALRRWMNAAALVRPAAAGGTVVVVADQSQPVVQALVRWDPATFADRELAARAELRFPPAARMAALTGTQDTVQALLAVTALPADAEVLGPVSGGEQDPELIRYLVRVPRSEGAALAGALHAGQATRTARKEPGQLRVQLDPATLV